MMPEFTPEEFKLILRQAFLSFIHRSFLELNPQATSVPSPHLEVLASTLDLCRQGKIRRLSINLPPRSLKSHSVSVAFVAWLLGHNRTAQVICASYGQE